MSFLREASRNNPYGLFILDGTSPFTDYSGRSISATLSGTRVTSMPLCAGASVSTIVSNSNKITFTSVPVWRTTSEDTEFAIETWLLPVRYDSTTPTEQQGLGNANQMDGITVNGTVVSFVIKYLTAPEQRVSYDLGSLRSVHVVAQYTPSKISLFINGVLVGETGVTTAQAGDTFATMDNNIYSGKTSSTRGIALNGVAFYAGVLDPAIIQKHYLTGSKHVTDDNVAINYQGALISLEENLNDAFINRFWTTNLQWQYARLRNVVVANSQIQPGFDSTGTSLQGTWTSTVPFNTSSTTMYGLVVYWDGVGCTVDISTDEGTTWVPVVEGVAISNLVAGTNPNTALVYIRVSFAGGVYNDTAYMDNLNVIGFLTGTYNPQFSRTVSLTYPAVGRLSREPNEFDDMGGLNLNTGGLSIGTSSTTVNQNVRTFEMLVKRQGTLTTNFSGSIYSSGVAAASLNAAAPVGQWATVHIVAAANVATAITLSGDAIVHHINLYATALTTTQMQDITTRYTSIPFFTALDTDSITITEDSGSATIYGNDWAILQSG